MSSPLRFAESATASIPLHAVRAEALDEWRDALPDHMAVWVAASGFAARPGEILLFPDDAHGIAQAAAGLGTATHRARVRFALAAAVPRLPERCYHLVGDLSGDDLNEAALGWLLSGYRFDRYKGADTSGRATLKPPEGVDCARLELLAAGEALTRDLINTPASDMGPEELEAAFLDLADRHGAQAHVTYGDDLLTENLPLIHAVGRASNRAPRLLDMRWGSRGPSLVLVGKGVCFDTGGLNLKPGSSMGLMKKDMGGAATVMGLAHVIMGLGWEVQLRVLVPAVENAVSADAVRPGDVLPSRKGLSIEVNNTDAEGRLVLADALALADEEAPDALVCMATLTGAARVALGPDLAPFYTDDPNLAGALAVASEKVRDPLWRMPFHAPYEALIEPAIADLDNAPSGGMAGSVTAALFLRRFVENSARFVHFDIYGWQPKSAPARPVGGAAQGVRALVSALPGVLSL